MKMRTFLLIAALATAVYFVQRNRDANRAQSPPPEATARQATASTATDASPAPSQAQHWPKRSIDRARSVANDVKKSRENFSSDKP